MFWIWRCVHLRNSPIMYALTQSAVWITTGLVPAGSIHCIGGRFKSLTSKRDTGLKHRREAGSKHGLKTLHEAARTPTLSELTPL